MARLPGNIRQLQNLIRQTLANKTTSGPLRLRDAPAEVLREIAASREQNDAGEPQRAGLFEGLLRRHNWRLASTLAEVERVLLMTVLERTGGNREQAAELLGVSTRTIRYKLAKARG